MKRNIEKKALKNSSVKAQATFYRNNIVRLLKDNGCIQEIDIPLRGPALLNMAAKLAFDFASWDSLLRQSLNSELSTDVDVYLYDDEHFRAHLESNALFLKKNYIPHVNQDLIARVLQGAAMSLPKRTTRAPLTPAGRKLCYNLCEQQLSLTVGKHSAIANIDGTDDEGLVAGFSQVPCRKNGDTDFEYVRFYSQSQRKMLLVPAEQVRAKHEFDAFKAYRAYQFAEYRELINERTYKRKEISADSEYVSVADRIQAQLASGKTVSVAVKHFISGEIHEFPLDDEMDIERLRELYHDTQALLFLARD
ncbi:hypothetical protein OTK49_03295 [Vibrio coralliirubri]|uniref:hypothetical protein n=1 Tax=Vibrio coralliirubri TaxID=1516159 RepID=UPI0022845827|nr:hypothetical protein [Vibrio coralliirubri]MCY9861542.1 hypothetical protein [Vibrio coralliirubri]